jgi:hypothetical protein
MSDSTLSQSRATREAQGFVLSATPTQKAQSEAEAAAFWSCLTQRKFTKQQYNGKIVLFVN